MKASLETSALFLSTTLELKNFVSPDLKFHCLSINFPGYPENYPDHQKNIKSTWKLSRLSKNLTDHPEYIQIIQK